MERQEYPKSLYLAGAQLLVADADQEAAARADGYDDWTADHERASAQQPDVAEVTDDQSPDRAALKVRATELGIEYPANIKTDKLAALVAAMQG